jgi:hypothetical protein
MRADGLRRVTGLVTVAGAGVYLTSDLLEIVNDGFPAHVAWLTYVAFLLAPFFIMGLHAVQAAAADWMSLTGAALFGAACVYFAATALIVVEADIPDYETLVEDLGAVYTLHAALLAVGAILFGWAVVKAGVLPRWTGLLLIGGMVLQLVIFATGAHAAAQYSGGTLRNVAFVGMGAALLLGSPRVPSSTGSPVERVAGA